jgi:phosphoribosylanthranilate isomerase
LASKVIDKPASAEATGGAATPLAARAGARTRVKICGLSRPEDALAACRFGADAIGLLFYPPSPRGVDIDAARRIRRALPPFITVVGVFVDPQPGFLRQAIHEVCLDVVQFHGDETPEFCAACERPYIKAVRVHEDVALGDVASRYAGASALLLDSYETEKRGGTGKTFDWSLIPADIGMPFILAGGLGPDNVASAVAEVAPFAVDGNSGVEASPGIKDHAKIDAFIREVNSGQALK